MTAPPPKVLVIDDEPPIRKLLKMGLTTQGYQILETPDAKTALSLLDRGPDLIILDLGLPDIQGHEPLRVIRARNESVPTSSDNRWKEMQGRSARCRRSTQTREVHTDERPPAQLAANRA